LDGFEDEIGHLRFPLRSLPIDQGCAIVHAHVGKLNVENPIGAHGLHPVNAECPTARAAAKWINMVDCVKRHAGNALAGWVWPEASSYVRLSD
jgi:hypothetical protein